jgi:hypothetical protein
MCCREEQEKVSIERGLLSMAHNLAKVWSAQNQAELTEA